jgi:hypothetical protein
MLYPVMVIELDSELELMSTPSRMGRVDLADTERAAAVRVFKRRDFSHVNFMIVNSFGYIYEENRIYK